MRTNLKDTLNNGVHKSSSSLDEDDAMADDLIIQKDYKIYLTINTTDPNSTCLPSPLKIVLKAKSIQVYTLLN